MAMVRQLTEGEIINRSTPEDDSPSEPMETVNSSRPSSRNSSSSSKRNSPVMPSLQYSKDDLMKFSAIPLSQNWPACLDPAYNNSTGKWDPERWFMNHRGTDRLPPLEDGRPKRDDSLLSSHKRKSSDPKERIKDEKDEIVLSPQRRSFGTGCHVMQQSSFLTRRPGSPTDSDNFREPSRRIGSGRIMTRDRDQRDWDRDREYGYGNRTDRRDRFDQDDDKDLRRYSSRYSRGDRRSRGGGRDRIDEIEPEWFSGGPTSQSETIELVGFEDPQQEGENRKGKKKRSKQNSRRSSLKLEEGEKIENELKSEEKTSQKKADSKSESTKKPVNEEKEVSETKETDQPPKAGFEIDELFKMDWIPGFIPNEPQPDNTNSEMGCSRFSQWFRKDSPLLDNAAEAGSRRSSLHDELIANVLNSIVEPQIAIPSPTQSSADNFFAPISPALCHSSGYSMSQTKSSKDIMEILQSAQASQDSVMNGAPPKESVRTVRELEADLKRIVLGDKPKEEKSAFDKLLQHMSDSSHSAPISMGPLDKSKALQEQDLLQDMLSAPQRPPAEPSPLQQTFQMFEEKQPMFKIGSVPPPGMAPFSQPPPNQNEAFAQLQKQQHEQHLQQQMLQMQLQNHLQQQQQGGLTVDMLAKLLQSPASPVPNRSDPQMMNSMLQYQRQHMSSMLKQQQQQPLPSTQQQRRCPSAKEIQTLALPTLGLSPRQSPLPNEALQRRIPSPLVFGQQPPVLSHAPAPIHPATLVHSMSQQNSVGSNTLQVQNPAMQRVPSPQELAVHTQSILQNALIKRKLEEQKENFRKRQEAQRGSSPVSMNKNGMAVSPLKGLSPTIAFTPTSVMRKIQSEKAENKEQKGQQNGNRIPGPTEMRMPEVSQNLQKANQLLNMVSESNFNSSQQHQFMAQQAGRPVHGQAMQRPIHGAQGRPIVKVGMSQPPPDLARANKTLNKQFLPGSNPAHEMDTVLDPMGKFTWQSQMSRQPQQPAMPQQLQMAATYAALNRPNLLRPVNLPPAPNANFPLFRNSAQNQIRAPNPPLNHLAPGLQRGALDCRQLQALAQSQRLQHLLMNSQNPVTAAAAQAQVVANFQGNRDNKHLHPGQMANSRQSPVNLAKWFGNDVLKQKMPEMPPASHQKALLVEEVERQQQQSVHN